MKPGVTALTWWLGCLTAFSCAATDGELVPPEADAGAVPEASPRPLVDGGASDAEAPTDAAPVDASLPKPLDVLCTEDPCYVAVSGNRSRHLCGLLADGSVRCWGRDTMNPATTLADGGVVPADGALGRGASVSAVEGATPAPVVNLANVTQISVGPNLGTCARTADGAVHCWGRNEFGQLGRPVVEPRLVTPTRVEGLPPVDEVQLGFRTGCAIGSSDRALYCWGRLLNGLGVDAGGTTTFAPQRVTTFRAPVKALAIGTWADQDTVIALLEDDILANIGEAPLKETSLASVLGPLEVVGVTQIGSFGFVASDGLLRRWQPSASTLYIPLNAGVVDVKVSAANVREMVGVTRASEHQGGALLATGRLFRWGRNLAGTLGRAPEGLVGVQTPLEVVQVSGEVVSFATAVESTCASLVSGKVKCWGGNTYGELGRGTVDPAPHPEPEAIR